MTYAHPIYRSQGLPSGFSKATKEREAYRHVSHSFYQKYCGCEIKDLYPHPLHGSTFTIQFHLVMQSCIYPTALRFPCSPAFTPRLYLIIQPYNSVLSSIFASQTYFPPDTASAPSKSSSAPSSAALASTSASEVSSKNVSALYKNKICVIFSVRISS